MFLFDEPLSNLDAGLRAQMRIEIGGLQRRLKTTTIYVTHDQVEAMTLGDRIVVLADGRIQQVGPAHRALSRPVNRFVAGFIGTPPMNFIEGQLAGGRGGRAARWCSAVSGRGGGGVPGGGGVGWGLVGVGRPLGGPCPLWTAVTRCCT